MNISAVNEGDARFLAEGVGLISGAGRPLVRTKTGIHKRKVYGREENTHSRR
jgi:hypothetical protein